MLDSFKGGVIPTEPLLKELPNNPDVSVTNMAEYVAAEVIEEHGLTTPLLWIEQYPGHEGKIGEYSLVRFSSWEPREVCLGGVLRYRIGSPRWSSLCPEDVEILIGKESESSRWLR